MYAKWTVILTLLVVGSAAASTAQGQATSRHREKAARLFKENDANKDGKLSREEFPKRYQGRFDTIDTNKDGFLTLEEDIAYRASRSASRGRQQATQPERSQQAQQSDRTDRSRVPEGVTVKRDIVYARAGDRDLPLDIYVPDKAARPMPVIIWVHGGGWKGGSKGSIGSAVGVLSRGYALVAVEYRLSGEAIWPAQIEDCKAAVRWTRANAAKYALDPDRIGAWGRSAGGHLVAMMGVAGDVEKFDTHKEYADVSARVQAVCDWFGPTDFTQMDAHRPKGATRVHDDPNSPESRLVGGPIQKEPYRSICADANPITYVTKDDPPILIMHGDMDMSVPVHQSELLYKALKKAGVGATFYVVKGGGHGFRDAQKDTSEDLSNMSIDFFDKQFGVQQEARATDIEIFSGEPRLLIVHGYSTSRHFWAFLQRKIDRYMPGPDKRVVEVQLVERSGTPIARWMGVETGEPSAAWRQMLTPAIQAEKGKRPVIVLAQQSLQWAFGERNVGIRGADDLELIQRGADIIEQYAQRILDDGAAAVVIGMHIYKVSMEPEIGNERLALAELMKRKPARVFAGPDVWTPTSKQHPLAFDTDKRHPNYIGAEIMAHYWLRALLEREGLAVPDWSRQEMEDAIKNKPLGLTRDRDVFQDLLKKWRIDSRRPTSPPGSSRDRGPSSRGGRVSQSILDRYDKDKDGKLSEAERAEFLRAREQRRKKR